MIPYWMQVNVNLAGLPALVLPCGFVDGGPAGLPVGLQMIGAAFDEVCFLDYSCLYKQSRIWKSIFLHSLERINKNG